MERRQFLRLAGAAIPGLAASHALAGAPGGALAGGAASLPAREKIYTPRYPKFGPDPDPSMRPAPVTRRLMVIILNPRMRSRNNVPLSVAMNFANPDRIIDTHIKELRHASYGYANYQIVERHLVEDWARWPVKVDGFRYTEASWLNVWRTRNRHVPWNIDHHALFADFGIIEKVASGHVDEVWHIGPPWDGNWEAIMAGPGASYSNAGPLGGTDHAGRRFVFMGYNHERSPVEMLHSYAHRAEGHLRTVFSRFSDQDNLYKRFLRYDLTHPGMAEFRIMQKVSSGHVDEVWHIGPPYDAKWEAVMVGPGASGSNAPPIGTDQVARRFVIMGYNFERSPIEMLHSYSHRAEGHLRTVHNRFGDNDNLWKRFIRYDLTHPGMAECGNVHFAPNGVQDYDDNSAKVVMSNCDDWYHFPYLNGNRFRPVNNQEWRVGGRNMYLLWWLRHLPHVAGECDGVALNWWRYVVDPNTI